jgi:NADPH2:quinone reductase
MKQIINVSDSEVKVNLVSSPIPSPSAHQVLIKVVVSGSNPKDWKVPIWAVGYDGPEDTTVGKAKKGVNQGDDIAGIVEKVGDDVLGFRVS